MWRAGVAQWWECSPPTHASQVRFMDPASYVGWVCCWFLSWLRGSFSGFSGIPPSSKIKIFKFQFDRELEGHGFVSVRLLCVTLVKQRRLMLMQLSLFRLLSGFKLTLFSLLPTVPNMMQSYCSITSISVKYSCHCNAIYILTVYYFLEDNAIAKVLCDLTVKDNCSE